MKNNKKAFTLIELLVVVLIIGILSAVALPQYQAAVQKSRYATLMPLAKTVKNAEEAVYLANSDYSNQLDSLAVQLPGTTNGNTATSPDGVTVSVSTGTNGDYVRVSKTGLNNAYVMYFDKSGNYAKEIHCEALKSNDIAKKVCLSYGPVNTTPISATNSNYETYVLEGSGVEPVPPGSCTSGSCYNGTDMDQSTYNWLADIIAYNVNGSCTLSYVNSDTGSCVDDYGTTWTVTRYNNEYYQLESSDNLYCDGEYYGDEDFGMMSCSM